MVNSNVAPVTKSLTFHSISSIITGFAKWWLVQNLDAEQQALAVNDASESSAGWYRKFNRSEGYQCIAVRVLATANCAIINRI